jgi:hypothetical protein
MERLINLAAAYEGSKALVSVSEIDAASLMQAADKEQSKALSSGLISGTDLCLLVKKLREPAKAPQPAPVATAQTSQPSPRRKA